jgi:hypothetical protein
MKGVFASRVWFALYIMAGTAVLGENLDDLESKTQSLLKPAQIADANTQLDDDDKHLLGIEDTKFLPIVADCSNVISDTVDLWKRKHGITARKQESRNSRVYVEVETLEPVHGSLIVIYRFLSADERAYLKFLFDSNTRIDPIQREQVIARFHLVELKRTLLERMKCG